MARPTRVRFTSTTSSPGARASRSRPQPGRGGRPGRCRIVAPALGWDEAARATEVELYLARVEAERESQQMPDDQEANAERTSARDARLTMTPPDAPSEDRTHHDAVAAEPDNA
jgi:hypothetical protein